MTTEIRTAIERAREALASKPAGASADRPATAVIEDGLRCRVDGPDGWCVVTDMPGGVGGTATASTPAWVLRAAWAACEATAIAMRAAELGVELTRLEVTATSETDMRGLLGVGNEPAGPARASMQIRIAANGTEDEKLRELVAWADSHSPVADAIRRAVPSETEIVTA
jgi:uncharacterized OsmC-like protein